MNPANTLTQLSVFSYCKKKKLHRKRLKNVVCPFSWSLNFLSYEVHTLWAWRDAEFWVHFSAFHSLCHWDICWQPKRVEAPLQSSLGAFMVYFVFVLYSRLTAVIFLLFFWYYYWQWAHFLTQTGCGLFVAIPYALHISMPEEASQSLSLCLLFPLSWVREGEHSPSSPICSCHGQVSSLVPAGLCSPGAIEVGSRDPTISPWGRQGHHQLSQGDVAQPLLGDKWLVLPDTALIAHCWWTGLVPSAQPTKQEQLRVREAGKEPLSFPTPDRVPPACALRLFPLFSAPGSCVSSPHLTLALGPAQGGAGFGSSQGHSWSSRTLACTQLAGSCSPSVHKHRSG